MNNKLFNNEKYFLDVQIGLDFYYFLNKKIKVIITKTIIAQIDKFFKNVLNLELD